jgi:hypothetical protein
MITRASQLYKGKRKGKKARPLFLLLLFYVTLLP